MLRAKEKSTNEKRKYTKDKGTKDKNPKDKWNTKDKINKRK